MPIVSESARVLREYQALELREARKRHKRASESHADARVLVARERIQARSLETALRKDRYLRAQLADHPHKASREAVNKHQRRKLALLHERPSKGMAVFVFKGFLHQQRQVFRHREVEVCEIVEDLGPSNPLPYTVRWNTDGARLGHLPKAVLLPFTDGQEEGQHILASQWKQFLAARPRVGSLVFVGRSALKRMAPDARKEGEVSPFKGRQTKPAQVITDLGPHKMWPYRVRWLHDGVVSPELCYMSAFELLNIEKGSKDDVVSQAAFEAELADSLAALNAYEGHKIKPKEFVKMKRGADRPSFMLALSRAATPVWGKFEKQNTDFTEVGTWESVKHAHIDELEDALAKGEPVASFTNKHRAAVLVPGRKQLNMAPLAGALKLGARLTKLRPGDDRMLTRSINPHGLDVGGPDKLFPSTRVNLSKRNMRAKRAQANREKAKEKIF